MGAMDHAPSGGVALVTPARPVKGADMTWHDAPDLRLDEVSGLLDMSRAATLLAALGVPSRRTCFRAAKWACLPQLW
jgi:hypothetical protein